MFKNPIIYATDLKVAKSINTSLIEIVQYIHFTYITATHPGPRRVWWDIHFAYYSNNLHVTYQVTS